MQSTPEVCLAESIIFLRERNIEIEPSPPTQLLST
jgi:hypothetical protein